LTAFILLVTPRIKKIQLEIRTVSAASHFAQPPSCFVERQLQRLARLLVFIHVGKIKIIGRENLDIIEGAVLICPNHPHYVDSAVLLMVLGKSARCMAHAELFRLGFGLGALLMSRIGAFPANDGISGSGRKSCQTAVNALLAGERVVVFPEGSTSFKEELLPLRSGATWIVNKTSRDSGKPAFLVPIFIEYGRYPGKWIQKLKAPTQYLLMFLGFWRYRKGVTVTIREPISNLELPLQKHQACQLLRDRILSLDSIAKVSPLKV